ncbi:hypothetical protein [Rummeliibacillus stabekisii]|uniref:glycosyl-4,4'-diaponeurosporenoate acyltransferase CrtO family protein n=1 Tax=Rummeliibacillus stabekisii TaxID=241244 RepID=UPI003AAF9D3F
MLDNYNQCVIWNCLWNSVITKNFIIQLPFCLIQRYNRPRLVRIKAKLEALI